MIEFVNAKINLGLNIVARRADGYHDLQTVFVPVGIYNGTVGNPEPFCDILEIVPAEEMHFEMLGRIIDCAPEKNLVWRAAMAMKARLPHMGNYAIILQKHLPDGAGMGGGSADGAFTLRMLNELEGKPLSDEALCEMALGLGADCPVFIRNKSVYAEGVGEKFADVPLDLSGKWLAVVKPDLHISTKEAFAGIVPKRPERLLFEDVQLSIEEWRGRIKNDFEDSLFPKYPELQHLKEMLYQAGAEFALMTGSGAALYGIYNTKEAAARALASIDVSYKALLRL